MFGSLELDINLAAFSKLSPSSTSIYNPTCFPVFLLMLTVRSTKVIARALGSINISPVQIGAPGPAISKPGNHAILTPAMCTCPIPARFSVFAPRGRRAFLHRVQRVLTRRGVWGRSNEPCQQQFPATTRVLSLMCKTRKYAPLCLTSPV